VLTYEFENISIENLKTITGANIYPTLDALFVAKDRLLEKQFFEQISVPTTQYQAVDSLIDLQQAVSQIGLPAVLKKRCFGYDGKGQYVIRTKPEIELAWEKLQGSALIVENLVVFERELSCIAVRNISREIAFYPLVENYHAEGILRLSEVDDSSIRITRLAHKYVGNILDKFNYIGVLAVEFFQKNGQLYANEMAPRVHNSGHWTIEGAQISQFENHLRAGCGLPLGATDVRGKVAMMNLIGSVPPLAEILKIPAAHCHLYGKTAQPKRKLGHVTLSTEDEKVYKESLNELKNCIAKYES
jgi:5-(carboxyamino)imidazole ribonucleotide synthase